MDPVSVVLAALAAGATAAAQDTALQAVKDCAGYVGHPFGKQAENMGRRKAIFSQEPIFPNGCPT